MCVYILRNMYFSSPLIIAIFHWNFYPVFFSRACRFSLLYSKSESNNTTWHTWSDAELRLVEGYVFQHNSITPSSNILKNKKVNKLGLHVWTCLRYSSMHDEKLFVISVSDSQWSDESNACDLLQLSKQNGALNSWNSPKWSRDFCFPQ